MKTFYSASQNTFYRQADLDINIYQNPPSDLVEVSDSVVSEFSAFTNGAKVRVAGSDGLPSWGERPPIDTADAVILKNALMASATAAIAPLQDAVDLDIATDEEKTILTEWKKYRVLLMRIDTSSAPDIEWPVLSGATAS
jgi:predicted regulator of Ras-like GTPase activity (Roadblock/LC7/MglB family)